MQDKNGNVEANGGEGIEGIDTISSSIDTITQIRQFFAALLTYLEGSGHAHLTFSYSNKDNSKSLQEVWIINEQSDVLSFSEVRTYNRILDFDAFVKRITRNMLKYNYAGLIYRVVRKKPETHSQYAELRGYFLAVENKRFAYHQLSAKEVQADCNTDPVTGKPLEPEDNVVYCGIGDDKIYNLIND